MWFCNLSAPGYAAWVRRGFPEFHRLHTSWFGGWGSFLTLSPTSPSPSHPMATLWSKFLVYRTASEGVAFPFLLHHSPLGSCWGLILFPVLRVFFQTLIKMPCFFSFSFLSPFLNPFRMTRNETPRSLCHQYSFRCIVSKGFTPSLETVVLLGSAKAS